MKKDGENGANKQEKGERKIRQRAREKRETENNTDKERGM